MRSMKHLPSVLLIGALALALRAEAPADQTRRDSSRPSPRLLEGKPSSDPFVKDSSGGDAANDPDSALNCQVIYETYVLDKSDAQVLLETERSGAARYRRVQDLVQEGKARLENLMGYTGRSGQRSVVEAVDEVRYAGGICTAEPIRRACSFPTAWETRNVGDTLEVEPVIQPDGRTCDLNLAPQRVSLVGFPR